MGHVDAAAASRHGRVDAAASQVAAMPTLPASARCYICGDGGAGIVLPCRCRGAEGLVHMSCLLEQAEYCSRDTVMNHTDNRGWSHCKACQEVYSNDLVGLALIWRRWAVMMPRSLTDTSKLEALMMLGGKLSHLKHYEDGLRITRHGKAIIESYFPGCRNAIFSCDTGLVHAIVNNPSSSHDELREAEFLMVNSIIPNLHMYTDSDRQLFEKLLKFTRARLSGE